MGHEREMGEVTRALALTRLLTLRRSISTRKDWSARDDLPGHLRRNPVEGAANHSKGAAKTPAHSTVVPATRSKKTPDPL